MTPLGPRHDWRDADGLRHRLGTSTHQAMRLASPRNRRYLRNLEFGWSAVAGWRSLSGQPDLPAGVRSGDVYLDISSSDAYNPSVLIRVGSGSAGADSATRVRRLETKKTFSTFPKVRRKPFKTLRLAGRL